MLRYPVRTEENGCRTARSVCVRRNFLGINTWPTLIVPPTPKESGNRLTNVSLRRHQLHPSRWRRDPTNRLSDPQIHTRMTVIQLYMLHRSNFSRISRLIKHLSYTAAASLVVGIPAPYIVCEVRAQIPYMGSHADYVTDSLCGPPTCNAASSSSYGLAA